VGCGEGIFADHLVRQGAAVDGFDINAEMIRVAEKRFEGTDATTRFAVGGTERMRDYGDATFDCVFALNIVAYLSPDDDARFYVDAARVLRPGGTLVITHSNELFDLYTLNRYTVGFFKRHFSPPGGERDVSGLLTHPDKPQRTTFSVRENPLSYRHKLARFGFVENRQEFAHFHEAPPLLTPERNPDDINAHQYRDTLDWPAEERWKLAFMCSMFGSRATKTERR
jgi:SAM-dependent methyltransferase